MVKDVATPSEFEWRLRGCAVSCQVCCMWRPVREKTWLLSVLPFMIDSLRSSFHSLQRLVWDLNMKNAFLSMEEDLLLVWQKYVYCVGNQTDAAWQLWLGLACLFYLIPLCPYHSLPCHAWPYHTLPCHAWKCALQYLTFTFQCLTTLRFAILDLTVLCLAILDPTMLYLAILQCIIPYLAIFDLTFWYLSFYTVLCHCDLPYLTLPYHIPCILDITDWRGFWWGSEGAASCLRTHHRLKSWLWMPIWGCSVLLAPTRATFLLTS